MVERSLTPGVRKVGKDSPYKGFRRRSFSKLERLLFKKDFSAVFSDPTGRFSANSLRILYRNNDQGLSRVGIIVPKKVVRLATTRNRYKRLIREQFRQTKEYLPNIDIVFLLNKKVNEKELGRACDRIWKFLTLEIDD